MVARFEDVRVFRPATVASDHRELGHATTANPISNLARKPATAQLRRPLWKLG